MTTRSLFRRLERLAERTMPSDEVRIWNVRIMNSDGTEAPGGFSIEWSSNPAPDRSQRAESRVLRETQT